MRDTTTLYISWNETKQKQTQEDEEEVVRDQLVAGRWVGGTAAKPQDGPLSSMNGGPAWAPGLKQPLGKQDAILFPRGDNICVSKTCNQSGLMDGELRPAW